MHGHDLATRWCMRTDDASPLEPERHETLHPALDAWRSNIGEPITFDAADMAADRIDRIDVLCWNVAIGLGRIETLIERLLSGAFATDRATRADRAVGHVANSPARPLVILLQEAFRGDASVPPALQSAHHGGRTPVTARTDIVALARRLGLSLRYSPSMRNGLHPSDRGNAILSNIRLADAHAFLLPYVRQRRVAVSASLAGHPRLRFVSAHLDTHGRPPGGSMFYRPGAGRAAQARALARSLGDDDAVTLLGADLNSVLGMTDPAVLALVEAGMQPGRRIGRWRHTYHHPVRMLVDHIMFRAPAGAVESVDVTRLDQAPGDRSRMVFGSDHHPLLAHVQLAGQEAHA